MGKKDVQVSKHVIEGFHGLKNYTWILASESRQTESLTQDVLALLYRLYYVSKHATPQIDAKEGAKPTSIKNFKRQMSQLVKKSSPLIVRRLTQTGSVDSVETAKLESKAAVASASPAQIESAFVLIGITKEALFDTETQLELSRELNKLHQLYPNTRVVLTVFNDIQSYVAEGEEQQKKLLDFSKETLQGILQNRAQLLKNIEKASEYLSVMIMNATSINSGDRKELFVHISEGEDWIHATQRFKDAFPDLKQETDIDDTNFDYLKAVFKISTAKPCLPPSFESIDAFRKVQEGTMRQAASAPMPVPSEAPYERVYPALSSSLPDSLTPPGAAVARVRSYSAYLPPHLSLGDLPQHASMRDFPPPQYQEEQLAMQGWVSPPMGHPHHQPTVPYGRPLSAPRIPSPLSTSVVSAPPIAFRPPASAPTVVASQSEQEQALLQALADLRSQRAPAARPPSSPAATAPQQQVSAPEGPSAVRALTVQWERTAVFEQPKARTVNLTDGAGGAYLSRHSLS